MKNAYILVLAVFFGLVVLLTPNQSVLATAGVIDQEYYKSGDAAQLVKANFLTMQSFRPGQPKLDKISVNLRNTAGTINGGISKYNGSDWDPVAFINDQVAVNGWNTFDFNDFDVTVGGRYRIWIEASSDLTKWYYGTGNPYTNGTAVWGQASTSQTDLDFQFRTYGYGPAVPEAKVSTSPSAQVTSSAPSDSQSSNATTTPVQTTVTASATPVSDSVNIADVADTANDKDKAVSSNTPLGQTIEDSAIKNTQLDISVTEVEGESTWLSRFNIICGSILLVLIGLLVFLLIKRRKIVKQ